VELEVFTPAPAHDLIKDFLRFFLVRRALPVQVLVLVAMQAKIKSELENVTSIIKT
jgi:hypothetical protein